MWRRILERIHVWLWRPHNFCHTRRMYLPFYSHCPVSPLPRSHALRDLTFRSCAHVIWESRLLTNGDGITVLYGYTLSSVVQALVLVLVLTPACGQLSSTPVQRVFSPAQQAHAHEPQSPHASEANRFAPAPRTHAAFLPLYVSVLL